MCTRHCIAGDEPAFVSSSKQARTLLNDYEYSPWCPQTVTVVKLLSAQLTSWIPPQSAKQRRESGCAKWAHFLSAKQHFIPHFSQKHTNKNLYAWASPCNWRIILNKLRQIIYHWQRISWKHPTWSDMSKLKSGLVTVCQNVKTSFSRQKSVVVCLERRFALKRPSSG